MYNSSIRTRRSGISIIEVLTSIVVAMIGVFGVMVLIPFAVKQAQIGLIRDAATVVGHNAHAKFEIEGFRRLAVETGNRDPLLGTDYEYRPRWTHVFDPDITDTTDTDFYNPITPIPVVIDPLYLSAHDDNNVASLIYDPATGIYNPLNISDPGDLPLSPPISISRVNLVHMLPSTLAVPPAQGLDAVTFDLPIARRMFRANDDLEFEDPVGELTGPNQIFDVAEVDAASPGPERVRRQSRGQLSWNALMLPVKDNYVGATPTGGTVGWKFRMFVMVHRDREIFDRVTSIPPTLRDNIEAATVDNTLTTGNGLSGGMVFLERQMTSDVRQDHWVMLINQVQASIGTTEEGFGYQVAFHRVISYDAGNVGLGIAPSLTLDGPDFEFGDGVTHGQTLVVHLPTVVNVYERSIRWERKSNWN